jgi:DNA invertase Pin-like site-specific DNA recombinase
MEHGLATRGKAVRAVQEEDLVVNAEIERRVETLDHRHGAGLERAADTEPPRPSPEPPRDGTDELPQYHARESWIERQPGAKAVGNGQHPLSYGHVRDHLIHQPGVLVDDLSRLSRDLGDAWRLIYGEFASINVSVIDCTTGMASDGAGARVTFGALALANDTFLQMVRTETHRGLEGRALAGFHTGGKTYGYTSVAEPNPSNVEHPRRLPVVDEAEAALVRRVFEMYADGETFKGIARTLNDEGLPAPHDGGRGNKRCHGWGHTTIRAMLANPRYIGR